MKRLLLAMLFAAPALAHGFDWRDPVAALNRQGNHLMEEERYGEALEKYRQAQVEAPERPELHFNLGVALAKQDQLAEAANSFEAAAQDAGDFIKSQSAFNRGWAEFELGQQARETQNLPGAIEHFEKAVEANQDALRAAPGDTQARHNLSEAMRILEELKQEQRDQQQQDQQEEPQDQQQQDQDQQQDQQSDQQQDSPPQDQRSEPTPTPTPGPQPSPQSSADQERGEEQSAQPAEPGALTEEQARRLLNQAGEEDPRQFRLLFVPRAQQTQQWVRDW